MTPIFGDWLSKGMKRGQKEVTQNSTVNPFEHLVMSRHTNFLVNCRQRQPAYANYWLEPKGNGLTYPYITPVNGRIYTASADKKPLKRGPTQVRNEVTFIWLSRRSKVLGLKITVNILSSNQRKLDEGGMVSEANAPGNAGDMQTETR